MRDIIKRRILNKEKQIMKGSDLKCTKLFILVDNDKKIDMRKAFHYAHQANIPTFTANIGTKINLSFMDKYIINKTDCDSYYDHKSVFMDSYVPMHTHYSKNVSRVTGILVGENIYLKS